MEAEGRLFGGCGGAKPRQGHRQGSGGRQPPSFCSHQPELPIRTVQLTLKLLTVFQSCILARHMFSKTWVLAADVLLLEVFTLERCIVTKLLSTDDAKWLPPALEFGVAEILTEIHSRPMVKPGHEDFGLDCFE